MNTKLLQLLCRKDWCSSLELALIGFIKGLPLRMPFLIYFIELQKTDLKF